MKTLAVMQPYFLPYIGYFQLMQAADEFVLFDDVNYINKGWINRNYFAAGSNRQLFTLPLAKAGQNKKINEIELFEFDKFRKNFFRGLEMSYKKAPFYAVTIAVLEDVLSLTESGLSLFLANSLAKIKDYLGIDTKIISTSSVYMNMEMKGQERIIDICGQERATNYINLAGGMELYDSNKFAEAGIQLHFLKARDITYRQMSSPFLPFLSIVDVMMNCSVPEIKKLLSEFEILNKES